jgi:hypothetical protein
MIVPIVVAMTVIVREGRTLGASPSRREVFFHPGRAPAMPGAKQRDGGAPSTRLNAVIRSASVKIPIAVLVATLLASASASAQSSGIPVGGGPGGVPFGAGTQRGLQSANNSGQNGFVTLFARGARTAVVVKVEGSHHKLQRAAIVRGRSCDTIGSTVAAPLVNLTDGISRGYVPMAIGRLTSGNYLTVVYANASPTARPVACGELYS